MKLAILFSLAAQVAYVISVPAIIQRNAETSNPENYQFETPDTLESRGTCWFSESRPDPACSSSGWCYGHCTRNNVGDRSAEYCWLAYQRGKGAWVGCKSNADCSIAINKRYEDAATCSGDGCKDCGCYCN